MYHYAGNNPVRFVDPDGRRMGMSADDEEKNNAQLCKNVSPIPYLDQKKIKITANLLLQQNIVMNDENFSQGSNGPYNIKPAIDDQTYCNYATYQVVSRTNPQMLKFMVNKGDLTGKNTRASEAGTNLKNAASDSSTGIKEIDDYLYPR